MSFEGSWLLKGWWITWHSSILGDEWKSLLFPKSNDEHWKMHLWCLIQVLLLNAKKCWSSRWEDLAHWCQLAQEAGGRGKIIHTLLSPLNSLHHCPLLALWNTWYIWTGDLQSFQGKLKTVAFALSWQSAIAKVWRPVREKCVIPCHFFNKVQVQNAFSVITRSSYQEGYLCMLSGWKEWINVLF